MWFKRKEPETEVSEPAPEKPEYWVSPFYVSWSCSGCGVATNYQVTACPRCCAECGCETFEEVIGRERRSLGDRGVPDFSRRGQFFRRGLEVPTE